VPSKGENIMLSKWINDARTALRTHRLESPLHVAAHLNISRLSEYLQSAPFAWSRGEHNTICGHLDRGFNRAYKITFRVQEAFAELFVSKNRGDDTEASVNLLFKEQLPALQLECLFLCLLVKTQKPAANRNAVGYHWAFGKIITADPVLDVQHMAAINYVVRTLEDSQRYCVKYPQIINAFKESLIRQFLSALQYGQPVDRLSCCDEGPTHFLANACQESKMSSFKLGLCWHVDISTDEVRYESDYHCNTAGDSHKTVWSRKS
jgi:hypothetical protein